VQLEDVFREHERAVFAYFLRVVGDRHDAEELTQETFFRACGAALRFRGDASIKTWLFAIARRVLMEASRKGLFEKARTLETVEVAAPSLDHDLRLDLEDAFQRLDRSDREVLMLVDFLGFTPSEAAELMGIEPNTFRMRLHRARARMRTHLEVLTP
jgi:RNA polymerase sigma-70 factor (ECF subfamily)